MHPRLRTCSRAFAPALLLSALLMQAPAHAQMPPPPASAPAGHAWHHDHGPWHGPQAWMKRFGITDAQRERIHAILHKARAEAEPIHAQLRALGEQERKLFAAPTIDVAGLHKLQRERMRLMARADEQRLQTHIAIAQVLTPEQRQQMAAAWKEHRHHGWMMHMHHPGPAGHPHPMPGASAPQ